MRLPAFVPLLGAFTAGATPDDLEQDAYIALAGPLTGLGLAAACYAIGDVTHDRFWFACADLSAFLNLFNMLPVPPFDGGRIIGAVWPPLWIAGFVLFIGFAIFGTSRCSSLSSSVCWGCLRLSPRGGATQIREPQT